MNNSDAVLNSHGKKVNAMFGDVFAVFVVSVNFSCGILLRRCAAEVNCQRDPHREVGIVLEVWFP